LEVATAGGPTQTQEWVATQYQKAAFEFATDPTLQRSSNGVEIVKLPDQEAVAKSSTPEGRQEAKPVGE
jgi:hypothetical protein